MSDRGKFDFSEHWFEGNIQNWSNLFGDMRGRSVNVLEIGAFEGASTTWILEELIEHPDSRMTTIDTFQGNVADQTPQPGVTTLQAQFCSNVEKTGRVGRLTVMKRRSFDALVELNAAGAGPFDLVYIDGSHLSRDVISDAVLCWPLLKVGGFLVFDDYAWDYYREPYNNPRLAVDSFMACYAQDTKVLQRDYQAIIQKTAREDRFTVALPPSKA